MILLLSRKRPGVGVMATLTIRTPLIVVNVLMTSKTVGGDSGKIVLFSKIRARMASTAADIRMAAF